MCENELQTVYRCREEPGAQVNDWKQLSVSTDERTESRVVREQLADIRVGRNEKRPNRAPRHKWYR